MNIGFIGTGLMGKPMSLKIKEAGFDIRVFNRTKEKAAELEQHGVKAESTVKELFDNCDTIITMLADYNAITSILFDGKLNYEDKTFIQMSTISPKESLLLKERIEKLGGHYFEAPVLGSIPQIENKELITLVGGAEDDHAKYSSVFASFSSKMIYIGETGKAAATKLALNQLIATETAAFAMSLGYIKENDIDVEKFMDILRGSALYAPTFDKKMDKYISRDYDNTHFPLKHLMKDVKLMLNDFGNAGINTGTLEAVKNVIQEGLNAKLSEKDYSSLYNIIHPKREK